MPLLPPVPKVIRCTIRALLGIDTDVISVFHCLIEDDGPYDHTPLQTLATDFGAAWATHVLPRMTSNVLAESVTTKDLSVADGGQVVQPFAPGTAGGASGETMPASTAVVASWKEGISYRGGHPRTYLYGYPVTFQYDPQHIAAGDAGLIQGDMAAFRTAVNAITGTGLGTVTLAVVHYRLNNAPETPPLVEPLQSVVVTGQYGCQRRRNAR